MLKQMKKLSLGYWASVPEESAYLKNKKTEMMHCKECVFGAIRTWKYSGIHRGRTTASSRRRFASVRPAICSHRTPGLASSTSRSSITAKSASGPSYFPILDGIPFGASGSSATPFCIDQQLSIYLTHRLHFTTSNIHYGELLKKLPICKRALGSRCLMSAAGIRFLPKSLFCLKWCDPWFCALLALLLLH